MESPPPLALPNDLCAKQAKGNEGAGGGGANCSSAPLLTDEGQEGEGESGDSSGSDDGDDI